MHFYNASPNTSESKDTILKHIGSTITTAAERIDGMFALHQQCSFSSDGYVNIHSIFGHVIAKKTLEQYLKEFSNFAKSFTISEYTCAVKRPLRLLDLWEDDPIGSAGPSVVDPNTISREEQAEIKALFSPFTSVIFPQHITRAFKPDCIYDIQSRYINDPYFALEIQKRKLRSSAIGEDFNMVQHHELVWMDLTFKLRGWALDKGYDFFVYKNEKEGNGRDCYVTLQPNQLASTGKRVHFLVDKYLEEMPHKIKQLIKANSHKPFTVGYHLLWGEEDPMCYWE